MIKPQAKLKHENKIKTFTTSNFLIYLHLQTSYVNFSKIRLYKFVNNLKTCFKKQCTCCTVKRAEIMKFFSQKTLNN